MTNIRPNDLLGKQPRTRIVEYLRDIGDDDAADRMTVVGGSGQGFGLRWDDAVWGYTGLLVGHIAPDASGGDVDVANAFALAPEPALKGTRLKVTLERFWVHSYPGRGTHKILCQFTGKNQIEGEAEELRFVLTTEAGDRSSAAVSGSPIFLGVSVGQNGIAFEGSTVNVRSSEDDVLLSALGSGPFRDGLSLLTTVQPALRPFVGLAGSLVNSVLSRSRNKPVYAFKLGLDFETSSTSAGLRHGSFVVVQGDRADWSWADVVWSADAQQLLRRQDRQPIERNYMVFRVSPYHDDPHTSTTRADTNSSPTRSRKVGEGARRDLRRTGTPAVALARPSRLKVDPRIIDDRVDRRQL